MKKEFKPMLAPNEKVNVSDIKFPIYASFKLDGIRCIFKDGEMLSRSLKQIPNKQLQEKYKVLKELSKTMGIIDGELYSPELTFQEITHFVMKQDLKDEVLPDSLKFYVFDVDLGEETSFRERVSNYYTFHSIPIVQCVEQHIIYNESEVTGMFEKALREGYEGLILKDMNGYYKYGRATVKQGLMYKLKPFNTYDLVVTDVLERFENTNESTLNELGYKHKSRTVDGVIPTGIAACFVVKYNDLDMKVSLTGIEEFRREIWENKESYIGRVIEVKGMEVGSKDVLRHPTFVRFRDDKNLSRGE